MLTGTFAAIVLSYFFLPDWPFPVAHPPFYYSAAAGSDAAVGLLFALLVGLFDQALRDVRVPDRLDAAVRWFADHTYSLYLYHFPLLFFTAAVVPFDRENVPAVAGLILLVLAAVFGLSLLTESRRPAWRRLFGRVWDHAARLPRAFSKWGGPFGCLFRAAARGRPTPARGRSEQRERNASPQSVAVDLRATVLTAHSTSPVRCAYQPSTVARRSTATDCNATRASSR